VELDVTRSADDKLFVNHNPSTPEGDFINELRADVLRKQGFPRVEDIFDALPPHVSVNVDVKSALEDATTRARRTTFGLLAPVLRREQQRRQLFVSSFDVGALMHLKKHVPGLPLGLIGWIRFPLRMAVSAAAHLGLDVVCLHSESFGPNDFERARVHRSPQYSIQQAHDAGLEVLGWCPDASETRQLVKAGIDAVCVNDVAGVLAAVRGVK
jgi:glycerophosphoryl diester phosphodiesterase